MSHEELEGYSPLEYLLLEMLAARYRMGHGEVSVPRIYLSVVEHLTDMGLVKALPSAVENRLVVWLTTTGRHALVPSFGLHTVGIEHAQQLAEADPSLYKRYDLEGDFTLRVSFEPDKLTAALGLTPEEGQAWIDGLREEDPDDD